MDLALLRSCTFVSFVTELSSALDHSSNAFALAQAHPKTVLHMTLFFLSLSSCLGLWQGARCVSLSLALSPHLSLLGDFLFVSCLVFHWQGVPCILSFLSPRCSLLIFNKCFCDFAAYFALLLLLFVSCFV